MDTITLPVEPRDTGKKAVKAVRNAGLVPCVLYGPSTEPQHFSVPTLSLRPLIFTTENYLVSVTIGGEEHEAILKDVDFHPVTDQPLHADFLALTRGEALTMTVPVQLSGTAAGVKAGGSVSQPINEIEIRCLPKDIPGHIDVDITALEVGESIHVEDLAMGEGIEILTDPARTLVSITAPRVVEEETDEEAEGLDVDAPAEEAAAEGDA